jgi:HEXXH motif-containing protein
MSAESELAIFSCPGQGDDQRPLRLWALWADYGSTIVDTFMIRFEQTLQERSASLAAALRGWLESGRPIEEPAGFPVDALLACASGAELDPVWAGVTAALHVGGTIAPFRASMNAPRRIRWRSFISPPLRSIEQAQGVVTIETADGARSELCASDGDPAARAAGWAACPTIGAKGGKITLMTGDAADTWGFRVDNAWSGAQGEAFAESVREALELIETHAPEYATWVGAAARMIIPVRRGPDYDTSHSFAAFPGILAVGLPTDRVMLGELLVHETAHLHYSGVSKGHTLTTMDDQNLYWSPFPRAERKIGMLMFGFHAFANIGIFRRLCIAAGLPPTGQDFDWQSDWMPEIEKVCGHLERSPGITQAGHALWQRAAHRLFGGKRWA